MLKKLKFLQIMVFSKKEVGDKTTYYLFGIPILSIEEELEYRGDRE